MESTPKTEATGVSTETAAETATETAAPDNIEQFPGTPDDTPADTGPTPLEEFNNAIVQAALSANAAGVPLATMARVSNLVFLGAFADILTNTPDDRTAFAGVVTCGQAANTLLQIGQ